MKLIVGLGNPGEKYAANRHNVGFMAVEAIADRHRFGPWRRKFQGFVSEGDLGGEKIVALKPDTYMNESGRAVGEAARFLKLGEADIIVLHDELDLMPGKLRIKTGGGNAGHNGLRSVTQHVGNEYARLRIGIGHPGSKDAVSHYVLNDFAKSERDWLRALLDAIADAAPSLAKGEHARFLTDVARALGDEEPAPAKKKGPSTERSKLHAATSSPQPTPKGETLKKAHPTGERAGKSQGAIAENIRKWLAARDKGE